MTNSNVSELNRTARSPSSGSEFTRTHCFNYENQNKRYMVDARPFTANAVTHYSGIRSGHSSLRLRHNSWGSARCV